LGTRWTLHAEIDRVGMSVYGGSYNFCANGRWGSETRGALLAFKADNGLPLTPSVDDRTWAALA